MSESEFNILSCDLTNLLHNIPLKWGGVQNNNMDDKIHMFQIGSYEQLEREIRGLSEFERAYFRRRWFLWKCSQCDEYLFATNQNVTPNPNKYDKKYDIEINGSYRFDVKGTVIPSHLRDSAESVLANPSVMVNFFYSKQSTGRRFDVQNRLFVVHHSFVQPEREMMLRCSWLSKRIAYSNFCQNISNVEMFPFQGVHAVLVFIIERKIGRVEYYFPTKL